MKQNWRKKNKMSISSRDYAESLFEARAELKSRYGATVEYSSINIQEKKGSRIMYKVAGKVLENINFDKEKLKNEKSIKDGGIRVSIFRGKHSE